jgi:hypothetical protein
MLWLLLAAATLLIAYAAVKFEGTPWVTVPSVILWTTLLVGVPAVVVLALYASRFGIAAAVVIGCVIAVAAALAARKRTA